MADLSKIKLNGTVYNLKDAAAVKYIAQTLTLAQKKQALLNLDGVRIVNLNDGTTTLAELAAMLAEINTDGEHVLFDVASLGYPLYLCTIAINYTGSTPTSYRLSDLVTGAVSVGDYDSSITLAEILGAAAVVRFPVGISITTQPTKTTYEVGESFDPTGMVVTAMLSDGSTQTVSNSDLMFSPSLFSTANAQTSVTVTYQSSYYTLTTTLTVSVVEIIPDTWAKIAQVTATGLAADYFDIADQITDTWGSYTAPWDVVHIDNTGMFLQWHYATPTDCPFDAPEAIYYAPAGGLAAGTYHITIGQTQGTGWVQGNSIQFTLAQAADEGDQLVIENAAEATDPTAGATINVYGAGSTTVKQSATTSNGTGGTQLGTTSQYIADGNVNATQFVMFGRNDWGQSAIRQYLNVRQPAGIWWTPQNGWDRPPAQAATQNSFAYSVSQDLWDVLEPVDVVTATNSATNPLSTSYTTQDRFFLPSLQEMYIEPQLAGVEGVDWDYYKELAQEAGLTEKFQRYGTYSILRKYRIDSTTSPAFAWLRSCVRNATTVWYLLSSGMVYTNPPLLASRCAPACKLKTLQSE